MIVDNLAIETACVGDAEDILALQKKAFLSEAELAGDYSIPPLTQTVDELREDFGRQIFFKAVADRKIVGSVRGCLKDGTCHIGRLIVHPDFQRHGIGTRLMHVIEEYFDKADRYEVFTGEKSERNIRLYHNLGYRIVSTLPINAVTTIVFMEKTNRGAQQSDLTGHQDIYP